MSYSVYLKSDPCPHCHRGGNEERLLNPTYNLAGIFDLALRDNIADVGLCDKTMWGLRRLNGKKASDTISVLERALARLEVNRERFLALEPANGFGTRKDAVEVFLTMLVTATQASDGVWIIS